MDPEFILDKLSSWLYEDTNDVAGKPAPRPRMAPRTVPRRPVPRATKPVPAVPEAILKRTPAPNAKLTPSLSKELKVRIDKSTGKPIIPEAWFNDKGKLKYSRKELNKAVSDARHRYRAERRTERSAAKARYNKITSSKRISASYAAEVEMLNMNFSFPNLSKIASRGMLVIGILNVLYSLLTGIGLESNNENIQVALDNGTVPLEGSTKNPLISHALYKIKDLVQNLKQLHENKQLNAPDQIKKIANVYRALNGFTSSNVNNKSDAQRLFVQASNLSRAVGEASTALDELSAEIMDENTKEKIASLQDTLDAIITTIDSAQELT